MTKTIETPAEGLIASTVTPQEYKALQERADRILAAPDRWNSQPRSRTVGELFQSIDESFKIVGSRTRKKSR